MTYELNKEYKIFPYSPTKLYKAIFVGYIHFGYNGRNDIFQYPVFKFDFYAYGDPTCFIALADGKPIGSGHNIEELLTDLKQGINYYGIGYDEILIARPDIKVSKEDFIKQAKNAGVSEASIADSLMKGFYIVGYKKDQGGEIKYCPSCKVIRHTSCVACGCGSCFICRYQWSCFRTPVNIQKLDQTLHSPEIIQ